MGGSISVKSGEGSGTTFICEIPFLISDIVGESMAEEAATQKLDKAQCELVGASILLVEDNVIAQHSQSTKFQSLGCSVDIAGNARVATELFKQKKFDLLVIDLGLPDLDGWSLARSFRSDRSNPNSLVPIVVLTAHADIDEVSAQYGNKLPSVVFRRKPLMLENARSLLHEYVA
jgi:CheY-like chemotaxis protein